MMARLVAVLLVGMLLAVGCSPGGATPAAGEVEVVIQNFAFTPQRVTVAAGTTVRWSQKDSAAHTATSDKGTFDSGNLSQGRTFSFKFSQAGTYEYHCSVHPNMKATVVVQ